MHCGGDRRFEHRLYRLYYRRNHRLDNGFCRRHHELRYFFLDGGNRFCYCRFDHGLCRLAHGVEGETLRIGHRFAPRNSLIVDHPFGGIRTSPEGLAHRPCHRSGGLQRGGGGGGSLSQGWVDVARGAARRAERHRAIYGEVGSARAAVRRVGTDRDVAELAAALSGNHSGGTAGAVVCTSRPAAAGGTSTLGGFSGRYTGSDLWEVMGCFFLARSVSAPPRSPVCTALRSSGGVSATTKRSSASGHWSDEEMLSIQGERYDGARSYSTTRPVPQRARPSLTLTEGRV